MKFIIALKLLIKHTIVLLRIRTLFPYFLRMYIFFHCLIILYYMFSLHMYLVRSFFLQLRFCPSFYSNFLSSHFSHSLIPSHYFRKTLHVLKLFWWPSFSFPSYSKRRHGSGCLSSPHMQPLYGSVCTVFLISLILSPLSNIPSLKS